MCLTSHARRAAGLLACAALTALVACGGSDAQPNTPVVIIDEPAQNNGQQPMEPCQAGQPGCDAPAPIVAALIKDRGQLTLIHTPSAPIEATGLAFNPERDDQLWVVQRPAPSSSPCTTTLQTAEGCAALEGRMTIIHDPGQPQVRFEQLVDPNSWHFLRRPTGLAFGAPGTFATCGEERTGNFLDQAGDFIGPTLWSSDMMIFAQDPGVDAAGDPLNGSHLDMLHATPWCMGIAHEKDNIYWAFNGQNGALDRYNFNADHGPGYHDHSDGEVYRYATGLVKRLPNVPSHMIFHQGMLYVADTGNGRVVRLDTNSGDPAGPITPIYEPLKANALIQGAQHAVLVEPGRLTAPSGMILHQGLLYVSDNATGVIHAMTLEGEPVDQLQTSLEPGALGPMAVGPDGKLYLAHLRDSRVWRVD